ncbi:MAG TPA: hypothetical protein PLV21_10720 [Cyclobacteriaceae bacterium]|nr:hypothetical protein [Cyclobacteriaceae bacterium]HRJ82350.1 hypothetical protein [Cyclobacteriaceae bacterium]
MLKPDVTVKRRKNVSEVPYLNLLEWATKERTFLILIGLAFIVAAFATFNGKTAMWFGFLFAAYAAVANDSIQSLGTFIESNKDKRWVVLWLFTGLIMLGTLTFSFIYFNGDVTYQRLLDSEGNTNYPFDEQFSYFQIIAPVVLLILTRLRMPVSTTFLLLSVFSADTSGITSVVWKSVSGYILAFVVSFLIWYFGFDLIRKYFKKRKAHFGWTITQWVVSGSLWSVWLMQDGANIAVFLPRQLELWQFIIFVGTIFFGLGLLFYLRGDKIQQVVSEKVRISDVRAATLIDFTYVLLLIYKLFVSTIPMSTTWVFLGTIGGREMAVSLSRKKKGFKHKSKALKIIGRDFLYATIGLVISVALASGANPTIRNKVIEYITDLFTLG